MVKKGKSFQYIQDEVERDYPGPITNNLLLKDFKKYLREDESNEQCNYALKNKVLEGKDYKLLPSKCWAILKGRFEGIELTRFKDSEYNMRKFSVKFNKIPIMVLPPVNSLVVEELPSVKQTIFMQNDQTFTQLKTRLFNILKG